MNRDESRTQGSKIVGCLGCLLVLAAGLAGEGQSSTYLLDLPGDTAAVRYSPGSLDRAVQLQDSFEALVEDVRGWTRSKVGLVVLLLNREEWQAAGLTRPYGVPEGAGGRGLAVPAWGDDGTVGLWRGLLGSRLPTLPDQPLRGTPEQSASLAVADLVGDLEGARILLRAAGISGSEPWVDHVLAHAVLLSNVQNHHRERLADVRMVFAGLAATGGGRAAYPLAVAGAPPSLAASLWFDSQYFTAAEMLVGPNGKFPIKAIFRQARQAGGRISAADLQTRCPELGDWLRSSFKSD